MARYDDLNTSAIAYATFVGSVLLLIIILLGRALCYAWVENEDDRKLAEAHYEVSDEKIGEQKAMLTGYKKVEMGVGEGADGKPAETKEVLHIPLERAKELILSELATEPAT